jgi:pimeloyl-ACP methyl ester carboxylesterase
MPLQFAPVAHRRITVDDIDIFYREAGSPSNLTVVLPHGYPCLETHLEEIAELTRGFLDKITIDR